MNEINTKAMSREELEITASDLGLTFAHNISDDKLRAKIEEALGGTSDAAETHEAPENFGPQKRFEIVIATHDEDKQPVAVGVNGRNYIIKRGAPVIVPECVVEVLKNAVQYQYDPRTMERSEIQSYPFQIVREA